MKSSAGVLWQQRWVKARATPGKKRLHSQHINILIVSHSPQTQWWLAWHSTLSEEQRNLTNCLLLREKGNDSPVTSFISLRPLLSSRKSLLIYHTEKSISLKLFHHKATSPPKSRASCLPGTWICPSLVAVCLLTSQRHCAAECLQLYTVPWTTLKINATVSWDQTKRKGSAEKKP